MVDGEIVCEYLQACTDAKLLDNARYFEGKLFEFVGYELLSVNPHNNLELESTVATFFSKIPLDRLSKYLNMKELKYMSILHNILIPPKIQKKTMLTYFCDHYCERCDIYASVLVEKKNIKRTRQKKEKKDSNTQSSDLFYKFPPDPPSNMLLESIIKGFCDDTAPQDFIERGCAVCGRLFPVHDLTLLNEINCDLTAISPGNIGQCERLCDLDSTVPLKGPVLADGCDHICRTCHSYLKKDKMPPESLANSFWIGSIPLVLQNLTFAEKMLISRIRHNKCLVRVSSGRAKMTANVIMFSNPTVKVYHTLPPSRRDISEILAFVFQGPTQPTDHDIKRTPMLVRRNVVKDALEWLKLNHADYKDLQISFENLNDYPLAGVPVTIEYSTSDPDLGNKIASAMSVYDNEFEDGTTDGPCPFTVHGLTGPEFENMSIDRLKTRALQHLFDKGATLGISHDSNPQSMYDNPQAYPQMFPWLFPYGCGGIGQKCHFGKISETIHKQNLLMYHDKRFQTDFYFPMIAFNHEQLKAGVTGSFLLAKRKMWPSISNRLKTINYDVLKNISEKLSDGAHFSPSTVEEKKCFQLLNDLDHVGGHVKGSITSKKHMRNEIWSMISQLGAPSWFITLSPADNRHPICLYYADENIEFKPNLRSANERNLLVARNPVAAARFFDLMVRTFIKHVLGIDAEHTGLYGDTSGYYGTVEQQGRLTLHLHTILWIKNALSPQEIRNKLMSNDSEFQQNLIRYLEGCQKGEFITGTMDYVKSKLPIDIENQTKGIHTIRSNSLRGVTGHLYQDPTQTLPQVPPKSCGSIEHINCNACQSLHNWWLTFSDTVDDILLRSNVHKCSSSDLDSKKFKAKGCLNQNGICKARFPRAIVSETTINSEDGYVNLKKLEPMLNTISPCITYLFRCNTDVTSLLSGTSIKAVISYVTDYIAKPTLKTYQIFATAYNVFNRNANLDADDNSQTDDARKLILKIVNALSSKMEIGSPMASMYLLQNPDHYTSHKFIPFWWKSFVNDTASSKSFYMNNAEQDSVDVKFEVKEGTAHSPVLKNYKIKVDCLSNKVDHVLSETQTPNKEILDSDEVVSFMDGIKMGDNKTGCASVETHIHDEDLLDLDEVVSLLDNMDVDVDKMDCPFSETKTFYKNLSEIDGFISRSLINDVEMDIDSSISFTGGAFNDVQKTTAIYNGNFYSNIENDGEFEDEEKDNDESEDREVDDVEDDDGFEIENDSNEERLLISQDGNDYVASSKVDDYKYRPEVYVSSSLYDWTKLYVKIRRSRKTSDKTCFQFLPGHGQINTHVVKLVPSRSEAFLLNFIGGPLPRCDQGDFEHYCCTMLTFFKPWRSHLDLKDAQQTWSEAFVLYKFKPEHKKIMRNFNLRYECLDERDDYHAILRRQSKLREAKMSLPFQDQHDNDCDLGVASNIEEDYGDQRMLGPNAIRKAQQMIDAELMMKDAGWLDNDVVMNSRTSADVERFYPNNNKTGSEWRNVVKQCREKLLSAKRKNYPLTINAVQEFKHEPNAHLLEPSAVRLLPAEYFMHNFKAKEVKDGEIIFKTISDFSLNIEQRRAFHIIANHATETCPDQLKMYLGGMGGTGKTQVIKALISMFNQRKEDHRLIVLAPTGTAAALLNGSTYHSVLGVRSSCNKDDESLRNESSVIKDVQERLEGVDYIFIDEISMIACHELYSISSQLSKVTNEHNKPFGGKNLILAGDFAQLPPTTGSPLYSGNVSKIQKNSMSKRDQESMIGKILWHQITTVVVLTQNMRQTEMSEDDKKFRTALTNMRYASCTKDDLDFLKTLHADRSQEGKSLSNPIFKNVSVITSLNTQKDQINESASIRFARETGQTLTHFFSIDKLGNADLGRRKRGSRTSKKKTASVDIPIDVQKNLWESSPHTSEHFSGKLSLCLGMPIMIRNNDATELCITKGQEAYAVGWDSIKGPQGHNVLETLFLALKNPPKPIELPGLPKNVIPMTRSTKTIKCTLPNDYEMNIIRQQINVLPNFSITDYASQGRTRDPNPVNLSHCRNFQSIYTCLSRSANSKGTIIIRGFNPKKITQGLSGHLRQEFRELHVLNNIITEIYEGRLDKKYLGPLRNPMLYKYQSEIKKSAYEDMHKAIKLDNGESIVNERGKDGTWDLNFFQKNFNTDQKSLKRKASNVYSDDADVNVLTKFKKIDSTSVLSRGFNNHSPIGLIWDERDYSCAYDSLFTVLFHLWYEGQSKHKAYFESSAQMMQILNSKFLLLLNKSCTFESIRDFLRKKLNSEKPMQYRYGSNYTDIDELIRDLTLTRSYGTSYLQCLSCKALISKPYSYFSDYTAVGWSGLDREALENNASIQSYLNYKVSKIKEKTKKSCPECRKSNKNSPLYVTQCINTLPTILIFAISSWIDINISLQFTVSNSLKEYILKGIIYSNGDHFTARLIDKSLNVWYHDGQTTRSLCQKERSLMQMDDVVPLKMYGRYNAIMAFYVER